MTQNKFRKRVLKNCWKQIRNIQNAPNMIVVHSEICDALADIFKARNSGVHIVIARKKDQNPEAVEAMFDRRHDLTVKHNKDLYSVLLQYVPDRLRVSYIYQNLVNKAII